jgi:hypothetical protein
VGVAHAVHRGEELAQLRPAGGADNVQAGGGGVSCGVGEELAAGAAVSGGSERAEGGAEADGGVVLLRGDDSDEAAGLAEGAGAGKESMSRAPLRGNVCYSTKWANRT